MALLSTRLDLSRNNKMPTHRGLLLNQLVEALMTCINTAKLVVVRVQSRSWERATPVGHPEKKNH